MDSSLHILRGTGTTPSCGTGARMQRFETCRRRPTIGCQPASGARLFRGVAVLTTKLTRLQRMAEGRRTHGGISVSPRPPLRSDDDLDRVADALAHDPEGLGDGLQGELVGYQLGPAQASLGGQ
jgi:hypothetical protein